MKLGCSLRALLGAAFLAAAGLGTPHSALAADPVVTVASLNPNSGVWINSCCGMNACALFIQQTPFQISCPLGTPVRLEAPATVGETPFTEWRRAGTTPVPYATTILTPDTNVTLTAVYGNPVEPLPDFAVTAIALTPASPVSGTAFSAQVTLHNLGAAPQPLSAWLDLWTDSTAAPACGTTGNAYKSFNGLAAGASTVLTFTNLTAGPAGTATFRAFADSLCGVAEADETNNQATLAYTVRPRKVLSVSSVNPAGAAIGASPADLLGLGGGTAPFSRSYDPGATVTLTASPTAGGNLFQKWQQDGVDLATTAAVDVTMNADHALAAVYAPPPMPDFTVIVNAVLPDTPVVGFTFRATVTVRNAGTAAGNAGTLSVWTNMPSGVSCGAPGAAAGVYIGNLAVGESRTVTVESLPTTTSGAKYLRAFIDSSCLAAESTETNNQATRDYLAINRETFSLAVDTLDLRPVEIAHTMDVSGFDKGTTRFTRHYPTQDLVTVTAPAVSPDGGIFQKWIGNGFPYPTTPTTQVTMGSDRGLTAVYVGPGSPDFVITAVTLSPESPPAGGTFSATVTVANVGNGRGVPGVLAIYLDKSDPPACFGWSPYGPGRFWDLAPGQSVTRVVTNLPAGARGPKTLRGFLDSLCETDEPDEDNNHFALPYVVVNSPPSLGPIGDRTVAEGGTLSFSVSATDANDDPLTFRASGLPDGALFDPTTRVFSWSPGYDQAGAYAGVRFEAGDGEATVAEVITITVSPTNRAPALAAIGDKSVNKGRLLEFTVIATDPDGDDLVYDASNLPGWADFDRATHTFRGTPGHDQAGSVSVTFTVTDSGSPPKVDAATVTITVINEAPTGITLSSNVLAGGKPAGTTVGTLATSDPDSGDSFVYTLVSGTGDTDNGLFQIAGNALRTGAVLDYTARNSFSLRVQSTDRGGLSTVQVLTVVPPAYVLWTRGDRGAAAIWQVQDTLAAGGLAVMPIVAAAYLYSTKGVGEPWQATSYAHVSATEGYVLWTRGDSGQAVLWKIDPSAAAGTPRIIPIAGSSYLYSATGVGGPWQATSYAYVSATEGYVLWTRSDRGQAALWKINPASGAGTPTVVPLVRSAYLYSATGVGGPWAATSYAHVSATEGYVLWSRKDGGQAALWKIDPTSGAGSPTVIPLMSSAYLYSATGVGGPWTATSYAHVSATEGYVLWSRSDSGQAALWKINPSAATGTPKVLGIGGSAYVYSQTGVGSPWQAMSFFRIGR